MSETSSLDIKRHSTNFNRVMSVSSAMDNSPTFKLLILFAGRIPFLHLQVIKSGDFDQMNHRQADEDSKYN